jgi:hypothetical protein
MKSRKTKIVIVQIVPLNGCKKKKVNNLIILSKLEQIDLN